MVLESTLATVEQNAVQKAFKTPYSGNYKLAFIGQRSQIIIEYIRLLNTNSIWTFTAKISPFAQAETLGYKVAGCTFKPKF